MTQNQLNEAIEVMYTTHTLAMDSHTYTIALSLPMSNVMHTKHTYKYVLHLTWEDGGGGGGGGGDQGIQPHTHSLH